MSDFKTKMYQIRFPLGPTSKEKEEKEEGRGEEGE